MALTKTRLLKHDFPVHGFFVEYDVRQPRCNIQKNREFPNLVVSNLVVCNFMLAILCSFALFCGLVFALFCAHVRSFARICLFLRPTAFRTTAFGNCRKMLTSQEQQLRPELQDWLWFEVFTVKDYRRGPFSLESVNRDFQTVVGDPRRSRD